MPATAFFTSAQVREMDRRAIHECGIPGYTLMFRAAEAAWKHLQELWPHCSTLIVCCGPGNNGGDGYIVAGLAANSGKSVTLFETGQTGKTTDDARRARAFCLDQGIEPVSEFPHSLDGWPPDTVIVDALLGTGTRGQLPASFMRFTDLVNGSAMPVLSIDVPTGINSDTGAVCGAAMHATATVTFIAHKAGQVLGSGPGYFGTCLFDGLSVPESVRADLTPAFELDVPSSQGDGHTC